MRSSIKYLCLILFSTAAYIFPLKTACAQTITPPPVYVPNVIPPSPEAAALMKFVDVPISPYTGTADITVPIYTIHAKGMDIPINLAYRRNQISRGSQFCGTWVGFKRWRSHIKDNQ